MYKGRKRKERNNVLCINLDGKRREKKKVYFIFKRDEEMNFCLPCMFACMHACKQKKW